VKEHAERSSSANRRFFSTVEAEKHPADKGERRGVQHSSVSRGRQQGTWCQSSGAAWNGAV